MMSNPRVLVVDDDPNLRKTLVDILKVKGFEVAAAATGMEGVAEAERAFVSVVLIDLSLPDITGIEVMSRIKLATPLTEAIILTGHAALESAIEATNKGAFSYLLKPYDMDDLLGHIRHAVERQQNQQEIQRLASFPELDPNPVIELDASGEVTYINPAAAREFPDLVSRGIKHPLLVGLPDVFAASMNGESRETEVREVEVGGAIYEQRIYAIAESGLVRITALDITERKQAEKTLLKTEQRYRLLFDTMLNGFALHEIILDGEGKPVDYRFLDANPAFERLTGLKVADIKGKTVLEVLPGIEPEWIEKYGRVSLTGEPLRFEQFSAELGKYYAVSAYRTAERQFAVIFEDITERKRVEEMIRASRDVLRSIVENIPMRVFWKDANLRYLGCNSLFAQDAGMTSPKDLYGKDDFQMAWRDQAELYRTDDRRVMDSDTPKLNYEEPQTTPGGGTVWVRTSKVPLHDADGKVFGMVGIYDDITERRLAELTLANLNRTLRTLSSGNEVLVHARDEVSLLYDMCRTVVEQGGYRFAWFGLVEHDEEQHIRPVASAGFDEGYLESLHITWADIEHGQGPAGRAVRLGTPQITADVSTDTQFAPWREGAQQRGYASNIALPLKQEDGQVFGVFSIYAASPDAFDEAETRLLQELADGLAFGILSLRTQQERNQYLEANLESASRLKETLIDTIHAIALTVEKRDPYTAGHQSRVAELAVAMAGELGLDEDRIEGLRLGGMIHDIGKIYIPAEILNRPGRLSAPEFKMIKSHSEVGYDIIKNVKFPWPVAQMILQHHERLDGSGYPRGLKSDEIIIEARILAVADVLEAMSSHRPYRPGFGIDVTLAQLRQDAGAKLDPDIVAACEGLFWDKGFKLPV